MRTPRSAPLNPLSQLSKLWSPPSWTASKAAGKRVAHDEYGLFVGLLLFGFCCGIIQTHSSAASSHSRHFDNVDFAFTSVFFPGVDPDLQRHILESNDVMLREAGFPGLTVFTEKTQRAAALNVSNVVSLPELTLGCHHTTNRPGCFRLNLLKHPSFWGQSNRYMMYLHSSARITNPAFIVHSLQHSDFDVDFAASPTEDRWKSVGMIPTPPFDETLFFSRVAVFQSSAFNTLVEAKLAEHASPRLSAQQHDHHDQVFSEYLEATPAVRRLMLPWRMHCSGANVGPGCWLTVFPTTTTKL